MPRTPLRVVFIALTTLACAVAVNAGVPEHLAQELPVSASPVDIAVLDDRVIALAIDSEPPQIRWFDSADFSLAPQSYELAGAQLSTLSAATLSGVPSLLVGGSQVDVLSFDVSTVPSAAPSASTPIGLGAAGGNVVALAFDDSRLAAYGADAVNDSLRHINLDGSGVAADFIGGGWPVDLGFVPSDVALLDASSLIVVGGTSALPGIALIDLSTISEPVLVPLAAELLGPLQAMPVSVVSDYDNSAWVLLENGQIWQLAVDEEAGDDDDDDTVGDDDDSAGDDDDSAGDDDDSAGDDDDSAGDDDDSAGDDDDSASSTTSAREISARDLDGDAWTFELLISTAPAPSLELVYRAVPLALTDGDDDDDDDDDGDVETAGYLYSLGNNLVSMYTVTGAQADSLILSGEASGLAASSGSDGYAYASVSVGDSLAVLSSGPWIDLDSVSPTVIASDLDTISVDFSISLGGELAGSCDYSFVLDGDITGSGTAIEGASGTLAVGEDGNQLLSGSDLLPGAHRVFVFCEDDDGDVGRASFSYYKGYLDAPTSFRLTPGDQQVRVHWDTIDSEEIDHYLVYFDSASFTELDLPSGCNVDASLCSPLAVSQPSVVADLGDDDASGDDDDSAVPIGVPLSVIVAQLTNGQPWYFAVAAVDVDGNIGPRTEVLSATPSVTGGAAALAGDSGGCTCESSLVNRGSSVVPVLLFAFFLLASLRRRRSTNGY
jgi:hypothetical protein